MSQNEHIPLKDAFAISQRFGLELVKCRLMNCSDFLVCGSIRRLRPICGDIDIAITKEAFTPKVQNYLSSILSDVWIPKKKGSSLKSGWFEGFKVEFYVGPVNGFGALTLFATGSPSFNILCRKRATNKGWKLNQYGLWEGERMVCNCGYENDILDALGLSECYEPERREVREEVVVQ
ncbi:MAG: hypothetical protein V1799_07550 [bacterium]